MRWTPARQADGIRIYSGEYTSEPPWLATVLTDDGDVFCVCHGETKEEAERRADLVCHEVLG